jgi:hypothetical protein
VIDRKVKEGYVRKLGTLDLRQEWKDGDSSVAANNAHVSGLDVGALVCCREKDGEGANNTHTIERDLK